MEQMINGRRIVLKKSEGRRVATDELTGIRVIAYDVCQDSDESLMAQVAWRALMLT